MLNPIVHIRLFIILLDGILQYVGARTILAGRMIQANGYREIGMGMDEGDGFNILAKVENINGDGCKKHDIAKFRDCVGLNMEELLNKQLVKLHKTPY